MAESVIALANERMSIFEALRRVGEDVSEFSEGSMKAYCPFGHLFHLDGGTTKALRIYPVSNSAYCFACSEFYSPVRLIARKNDTTDEVAAQLILDETGYVAPDYQARWEALMGAGTPVDHDDLSEALKMACQRMDPAWDDRQFDERIAVILRKCLGLLSKVRTSNDASQWLTVSKMVMERALGESDD